MCHLFSNRQSTNKVDAKKEMQTLAISNFDLPGDRGFPLNALYSKPADRSEAGIDQQEIYV